MPQTTAAISLTSEEKRISRVYWSVAALSKRRSISVGSRVRSKRARTMTEMGACWRNRSKVSPSCIAAVPGLSGYPWEQQQVIENSTTLEGVDARPHPPGPEHPAQVQPGPFER